MSIYVFGDEGKEDGLGEVRTAEQAGAEYNVYPSSWRADG